MPILDLAKEAVPLPMQLVLDTSLLLACREGDDNPFSQAAQKFIRRLGERIAEYQMVVWLLCPVLQECYQIILSQSLRRSWAALPSDKRPPNWLAAYKHQPDLLAAGFADMTDDMLCQAVSEMLQGLVDADLGGNLLKKRISLSGRRKRGGGRTIVATNRCDRWFFLVGFEKNERANISKNELKALRELAAQYLAFDDKQIEWTVQSGKLMEVCDDHNKT